MRHTPPDRRRPWQGCRRLLAVADVQTGYHHGSISHALSSLEQLGRAEKAFVTELRTDSQLITRRPILGTGAKYGGKQVNARNLDDFGAMFLLPSGAGTLSAEQKADLLAFVHDDGKGLVVGHAATVAYFDWPEWAELIGGRLAGELDAKARILVEDPDFPGADSFGTPSFEFAEQHPILREPYDRTSCDVVMRLEPASIPASQRGRRDDGDYPVVWTRRYGAGRVVNIGWGHHEHTWDDPRFRRLVLGAVLWAFG